MKRLSAWFERVPAGIRLWIAFALVGLVGMADWLTGPDVSAAVFFVLPVTMAAWWSRRIAAWFVAASAALAWYAADLWAGHEYFHPWVGIWNGISRFITFAIILLLVRAVRRRLAHERANAESDSLTGLLNPRGFSAQAERELERARRFGHPFAVAFMDLDHFKAVNDEQGHAAGDAVLRRVAEVLRHGVRASDLVARLGGDEFVLLLVESDQGAARAALAGLRRQLLEAMAALGVPVTFSIGVAVFERAPADPAELLGRADHLMYEVKHGGRDAIRLEVYGAGE